MSSRFVLRSTTDYTEEKDVITNIDKTSATYKKTASALLVTLTLAGALLSLLTDVGLGWILIIATVFHAVCSMAYIYGWKAMARRSPETLPKYYLAGSAFRLMAAAIVLLVVCVVKRADIDAIRWFTIVFIVYYLVMLIFDAIFFAKVSKKQSN